MEIYNFIIENKEVLKIFYAIIIGAICTVIVLKSDRLFRLSFHQGIRYFRNAFLFYGLAFVTRYFISPFLPEPPQIILKALFEYFLVMAGFFLLYSLLWKKIESTGTDYVSSLFNKKLLIFYFMAFVIIVLDYLWNSYYFLFSSQIILFIFASIISFSNYIKNGKKGNFLKFYFIAMILNFFAWILNAFVALYFEWSQLILIFIYAMNLIIFLLFLWGVIKVMRVKRKWQGKEKG